MIGVPGTAHRLFGALREEGISVILISQGSSEHSICCAIPQEQAERAAAVVQQRLRARAEGRADPERRHRPRPRHSRGGGRRHGGHAGRRRQGVQRARHLERQRARHRAGRLRAQHLRGGRWTQRHARPARGACRSVPVAAHDLDRRDRAGHRGTRAARSAGVTERAPAAPVQARPAGARHHRLEAHAAGGLERRRSPTGARSYQGSTPHGGPGALRRARARRLPATHRAARLHGERGDRQPITPTGSRPGIHVVTPNKKANSADLAYYQRPADARRAGASHYLYEATVGAGLPVVQTLRDLVQTGDEITRIEGIFSGTLAYLFNIYDGRQGFSDIVRDARQRGYTEPDPRDDLSGHGRRPQAHHPRARDGAAARDGTT